MMGGWRAEVEELALLLISLMLLSVRSMLTRDFHIGNAIISTRSGRPVVNIAVGRRNASGNIIASVSNGCAVRVGKTSGTALTFSCIKYLARGRMIGRRAGALGVALTPSSGVVSRIIIITCNIQGGKAVTNSISTIGTRGVRGIPTTDFSRTLRKRDANLRIVTSSNRPDGTTAFRVHNAGSVGSNGTPLFVLSNMPVSDSSFGALDPGSVRDVSMLGSTSSASVCNTHTTGNIIIVASGQNLTVSGTGVALHTRCNFSRLTRGG